MSMECKSWTSAEHIYQVIFAYGRPRSANMRRFLSLASAVNAYGACNQPPVLGSKSQYLSGHFKNGFSSVMMESIALDFIRYLGGDGERRAALGVWRVAQTKLRAKSKPTNGERQFSRSTNQRAQRTNRPPVCTWALRWRLNHLTTEEIPYSFVHCRLI